MPSTRVFELNSKRTNKDRIKKNNNKHTDSKTETSLEASGLFKVLSTFLSISISIKSLIIQPELLIKKEPTKNKQYQYTESVNVLSRLAIAK